MVRTHENSFVVTAEQEQVCKTEVYEWLVENCAGHVEIHPVEDPKSNGVYALFSDQHDASLFALRWL